MKRKLLSIILVLFIFGCKNDPKDGSIKFPLEDPLTHAKIRPITEDFLEEKTDSIKKYYQAFNNYEIWYNDENRRDLINEIKFSYQEGLNPKDYNYDTIKSLENRRKKLSDNEVIKYDILLTESFEKLANNLHGGKTNPKRIYENWDIPVKKIKLIKLFYKGIKYKAIASTFKTIKPQHITYKTLKKSLIDLNNLPEYNFKKNYIKDKIELNDTIQEIVLIKKKLIYWKDYKNKDSILTPIYDNKTFLAIKKFQKRHGLSPDGVIGQGTIKALNYSQNDRREQIYANLERWKWFPKDFGSDYLLINLPDYQLAYVHNKDTLTTRRVVVGKATRQTPIISSKLSNFVFNPTWTVPPTIIKEDLTPSATKNRNYFNNTRITIYDTTGNEVTSEDWNPENSKTYRYVQTSGYNNSLGLVKFNFNNRHSVYLHDTNHRDYFVREYRALSSGCVRIENPISLAELILSKENKKKWTKKQVDKLIENKKTQYVSLNNSNINVFLFYWTSWSNNEGLQFREDIYNLDKTLFRAL